MNLWVVDASVVIKWFIPEVHTDQAITLLQRQDDELCAPDLLLSEAGNIIWKKVRRQEITQAEGLDVLQAIQSCPLDIYPGSPMLDLAYEIACGLERTFYDSLYLALAVQLDGKMITPDKKLFNSVKQTNLGPYISLISHL